MVTPSQYLLRQVGPGTGLYWDIAVQLLSQYLLRQVGPGTGELLKKCGF